MNKSLAKFSRVTRGLWVSGVILIVAGLLLSNGLAARAIVLGDASSMAASVLTMGLSAVAVYIGLVLIFLAIFSAFLRITAKAIIEGLGGSVMDRSLPQAPTPEKMQI